MQKHFCSFTRSLTSDFSFARVIRSISAYSMKTNLFQCVLAVLSKKERIIIKNSEKGAQIKLPQKKSFVFRVFFFFPLIEFNFNSEQRNWIDFNWFCFLLFFHSFINRERWKSILILFKLRPCAIGQIRLAHSKFNEEKINNKRIDEPSTSKGLENHFVAKESEGERERKQLTTITTIAAVAVAK